MSALLVLKAGTTLPEISQRRGDYEDWIAAGMKIAPRRMRVVRAFEAEPLPDPGEASGVVITGSSAMVTDGEAWSEAIAAWLPSVRAAGTPLLGICYGHQLLAHAFGGRVGDNPQRRSIGSVELRLEPDAASDPLLGALLDPSWVQTSHVQSVIELPPGARRLASSPIDPNYAFALDSAVWGVQFHPEFDADIVRGYIAGRSERLREEGLEPRALAEGVRETPTGSALLSRFRELLRD